MNKVVLHNARIKNAKVDRVYWFPMDLEIDFDSVFQIHKYYWQKGPTILTRERFSFITEDLRFIAIELLDPKYANIQSLAELKIKLDIEHRKIKK